jgi:hypothetical protein
MSDGSSEESDQGDASDVVEAVASAQPPSAPATRTGNKRDYTFLNRAGLAAEAHFAHRRAKTAREVEAIGTPRPAADSAALTLTAATSGPKLTKEQAVEAADAFVRGREEGRHGTHLVVYSDSAISRGRKGSNMAEWYVLCWIGTFVDAGYYMCPRAMGRESVCKKKSRVLRIQYSTSGSGTYTRHLEKHETASQTGVGRGTDAGVATASTGVLVKFAAPMKQRIADAAVVGVCLDHQSYGFASAPGVQAIVAAAVKAAAGYGPATTFDVGNYLSCAPRSLTPSTAAAAYRRADMGPDGVFALASIRGGGASTDGWKCARTGRKFYDWNISCLEVFAGVGFGQATVHISNRCIVFANHDSRKTRTQL